MPSVKIKYNLGNHNYTDAEELAKHPVLLSKHRGEELAEGEQSFDDNFFLLVLQKPFSFKIFFHPVTFVFIGL